MITQKKYLNLIALLMALITGMLFLPGLSHADLTVEGEYSFGEVEVGTLIPKSATLTISNPDYSDDEISTIILENKCGFIISPEVSFYRGKRLPVDIIINYVPLSEGRCEDKLSIYTIRRGSATVTLSGTGIITKEITIEGILFFFDSCVAEGKLEGYVPNKSDKKRSADKITKGNESDKLAENRLNALRNMIESAGDLIDSGKIDEACGQLEAAYKKMDGLNTPGDSIDFVEGSAVSELAEDVKTLMDTLECK